MHRVAYAEMFEKCIKVLEYLKKGVFLLRIFLVQYFLQYSNISILSFFAQSFLLHSCTLILLMILNMLVFHCHQVTTRRFAYRTHFVRQGKANVAGNPKTVVTGSRKARRNIFY